jgi:hypothetical protein
MRGRDEEEKRTGMNLIEYVESVKVDNGKPKLKKKRRLYFCYCSPLLTVFRITITEGGSSMEMRISRYSS